ncbi:MAG: phage holin family protein [Deltaproteobacteria bacterium]|nr:phage holin family protein [Deltaproteobacteria bacterium]
MHILLSWLMLSVVVWLTAMFLPGIKVKSFVDAIVVAAIFGVLNWLIGWLLFAVIGIFTLGLGFLLAFITRWVVNALLLHATGKITDRVKIDSFLSALIGALCISALGTLGEWIFKINAA